MSRRRKSITSISGREPDLSFYGKKAPMLVRSSRTLKGQDRSGMAAKRLVVESSSSSIVEQVAGRNRLARVRKKGRLLLLLFAIVIEWRMSFNR